jgi:hypothetical protein
MKYATSCSCQTLPAILHQMNAEERNLKIKTLRKLEERKLKLPELISFISSISEKIISENEILTIEEIEQKAIELNGTDFKFNYLNLSFTEDEISNLSKTLITLKAELSKENFLKLYRFTEIAILKIETKFIIENIVEIIKFDGDSFSIYDKDFKNGFWIDYSKDYWFKNNKTENLWIYELRIFGKDWIKLISAEI